MHQWLSTRIPAIIWAASQYGGVGAGYVWLGMNLISFVAWLPLVHHKFESELNLKWYCQDILIIFLAAAIVGFCLSILLPQSDSGGMQLMVVFTTGLVVVLAGAAASSEARAKVNGWLLLRQQRTES